MPCAKGYLPQTKGWGISNGTSSLPSTAVTIGFDSVAITIAEDGGFVTLTMKVLSGTLGRTVHVQLDTKDGSAIGI